MDKTQIIEQLKEKQRKQAELDAVLEKNFSHEDAKEIKRRISGYFYEKLIQSFEKQAIEEGWTQETYTRWANEHFRTPYEKQ
jgi:hypothetical protein